jgi:uncharacterized protein
MKITKFANLLIVVAALNLSACAMTFQYNTVAGFDDYAGVFEGTVSVTVGGRGEVALREVGGGITCYGSTQQTGHPGGLQKLGANGTAEVKCSDGRRATATWFQSVEEGGSGVGQDQNGNQLRLRYDLDQSVLEDYKRSLLAASARKAKAPSVAEQKRNKDAERKKAEIAKARQVKEDRQKRIEEIRKRKEQASREVKPEPQVIAEKPKPKSNPPAGNITSGSGFFVSKLGYVVTNQHVVGECKSISVGDSSRKQIAAELVQQDKKNDLALLKISSTKMASADTKSLIRKLGIKVASRNVPLSSDGLLRSEDVELGERVMVSGFPYGEIFSDTIKVTGGMVSAIRGMGDDSGQFQIDAAVQPGNSGGPIYDGNGNIVGVVVSQLNKLKVAKVIGSLPENVNFGIKASTVRQFLTSAGLPTKWSNQSEPLSSGSVRNSVSFL